MTHSNARIAATLRAAQETARGQTVGEFVVEFGMYLAALDGDATNEANARALATAVAKDPALVEIIGACRGLIGAGKA